MGEAKLRRAKEGAAYGRTPKNGRGLIVSSPIKIDIENKKMKGSSQLDPLELRASLLFWDRLVWPQSSIISFGGGPDEEFLESEGILSKPMYRMSGDAVGSLAHVYAKAFAEREEEQPGSWAIAQGENSINLPQEVLAVGRGALVQLHRAIPVPQSDVPLAEILELKHRYGADLLRLRAEIDNMFEGVASSSDPAFSLSRNVEKIDAACADVLKLSKEWGYGMHVADLKATWDIKPYQIAIEAAKGFLIGQSFNMPIVGALLGATHELASNIKVSSTDGLKARLRNHPYLYVARAHEKLT